MVLSTVQPHHRWQITLRGSGSLDEDLGSIGEYVGPRKGRDKRTQGEMEDFVLRRVIVAHREVGLLEFPATICAETVRGGSPDFVIEKADGNTVGLEVTQAGESEYQRWLTVTESATDADDVVLLSGDGIVPRVEIDNVAKEFARVIVKKLDAYRDGKYRNPTCCDLAVFDNTKWGWNLDHREITLRLQGINELRDGFSAIHLVFGSHVVLDALGDGTQFVDVSRCYEIDLANWLFDQAGRLKRRDFENLDNEDLAEELESLGRSQRRAFRSHLRNRLIHMIKWNVQPEIRSRSWYSSIGNSLSEMEDLIASSPSLGPVDFLSEMVTEVFPLARREALRQTRLPAAAIAEECPYSLEQILDEDFAGPEPEED